MGLNADGTWEIERVLKKSGKRFLIRWKGWTEEHDSLVSRKELTRAIVEEFEEREEIVAARKKRKTRPPFTSALTVHESSEIKEWRILDTGELIADVANEASAKVQKTKTALSEVRFFTSKPVSAGTFTALQAVFVRASTGANAVTGITSLRGGLRPVDTFAVMDDDILDTYFGNGIFHIHPTRTECCFWMEKVYGPADQTLTVTETTTQTHISILVTTESLHSSGAPPSSP